MTYTDTGTRGAKVQSWRAANPRDLLKRVIDDNPGADRAALLKMFNEALQDDGDDYIETIIEYWFTNNYQSLVAPRFAQEAKRQETYNQAVAGIREQLRKRIEEGAAIVLLDMTMPNGKRLADCTGSECIVLRRSIGGWLGRVARRVKPDETVGATLSEQQLQALYKG